MPRAKRHLSANVTKDKEAAALLRRAFRDRPLPPSRVSLMLSASISQLADCCINHRAATVTETTTPSLLVRGRKRRRDDCIQAEAATPRSATKTAALPQMQEQAPFVLAGSGAFQQTPAKDREITDRC
jgi:hypothetical protein